jgi:hypothetical protein
LRDAVEHQWPHPLELALDDIERIFFRFESSRAGLAVKRARNGIVFDRNYTLRIDTQERIAPDLFSTFHAFQQERRRPTLGQLEIDRNRRLQVGEQRPVNRYQIASFK